MKKVISLALAAVICSASMLLAACGGNAGTATKDETPANTKTIATVDDLEGAKIGVQLGTTGDIYASDYEEKGSTVERFNKVQTLFSLLHRARLTALSSTASLQRHLLQLTRVLKFLTSHSLRKIMQSV